VNEETPNPRWPWLLLAVFLLGCVLAVLWLRVEVKRVQRIHDLNAAPPAVQTNAVAR
jgi:bacteriorhodopsin